MGRDTNSPSGQMTPDEQPPEIERGTYGDRLAMPQEDDPVGDGHMWSGKTDTLEDRPEADTEVGGPGHVPTHPAGPIPF